MINLKNKIIHSNISNVGSQFMIHFDSSPILIC